MKLILPKIEPNVSYRDLPLFFLAGPILGGGDWHVRMSQLLEEKAGDCVIVNPSRYTPEHPLFKYKLPGEENHYEHQTAWERWYLNQAARHWPAGCVVFWLAAESKEHPRADGQPYAMDTRGEVGEWRGRLMDHRLPSWRVAIGADPEFPGLRTIHRNFTGALGAFPIFSSMEDVATQAVHLATVLRSKQ